MDKDHDLVHFLGVLFAQILQCCNRLTVFPLGFKHSLIDSIESKLLEGGHDGMLQGVGEFSLYRLRQRPDERIRYPIHQLRLPKSSADSIGHGTPNLGRKGYGKRSGKALTELPVDRGHGDVCNCWNDLRLYVVYDDATNYLLDVLGQSC